MAVVEEEEEEEEEVGFWFVVVVVSCWMLRDIGGVGEDTNSSGGIIGVTRTSMTMVGYGLCRANNRCC